MKTILILLALSMPITGLSASDEASAAKTIPFKLTGKTRVKNEKHEFWLPHPEGPLSVLLLPEDPRTLCAKSSPEGAAAMKDMEGLQVGRFHMSGQCVADPSGKFHVVTVVETMMPAGEGVVRTEEREVTGKVEVKGDPAKGQGGGSMIIHASDGTEYFIPPKKFDPKPDGLDYMSAAKLAGQQVTMKASVQIHREPPHRVAKVIMFRVSTAQTAK
ncbi:MAG TPA: hypothetical protein DIT13_02865 [Verrucomicrobiales bacterium]|nr:hypothetical protein [Verrucomicrobiales bacterium]HRJ08053.1 hypothetical protein [Prosthecobacter sp.]HRK14511.1 hypothetical protein [Prosthecobacter sp.]